MEAIVPEAQMRGAHLRAVTSSEVRGARISNTCEEWCMEALENLEVWRRACRLSVDIYQSLSECREYGFRDQITRSALSIPSNIAEGYEYGRVGIAHQT